MMICLVHLNEYDDSDAHNYPGNLLKMYAINDDNITKIIW